MHVTCPACFSQMIKVRRRPADAARSAIRCIHCQFTLPYKDQRSQGEEPRRKRRAR